MTRFADDVDLGQLDWRDTEPVRRATTDSLRIALRYGTACSQGIVLRGTDLVEQNRAAEIAQSTAAAASAHEHGRALDQRIAETAREAIEESMADIAEQIAAKTPEQTLIDHWRKLGGSLPTPL